MSLDLSSLMTLLESKSRALKWIGLTLIPLTLLNAVVTSVSVVDDYTTNRIAPFAKQFNDMSQHWESGDTGEEKKALKIAALYTLARRDEDKRVALAAAVNINSKTVTRFLSNLALHDSFVRKFLAASTNRNQFIEKAAEEAKLEAKKEALQDVTKVSIEEEQGIDSPPPNTPNTELLKVTTAEYVLNSDEQKLEGWIYAGKVIATSPELNQKLQNADFCSMQLSDTELPLEDSDRTIKSAQLPLVSKGIRFIKTETDVYLRSKATSAEESELLGIIKREQKLKLVPDKCPKLTHFKKDGKDFYAAWLKVRYEENLIHNLVSQTPKKDTQDIPLP